MQHFPKDKTNTGTTAILLYSGHPPPPPASSLVPLLLYKVPVSVSYHITSHHSTSHYITDIITPHASSYKTRQSTLRRPHDPIPPDRQVQCYTSPLNLPSHPRVCAGKPSSHAIHRQLPGASADTSLQPAPSRPPLVRPSPCLALPCPDPQDPIGRGTHMPCHAFDKCAEPPIITRASPSTLYAYTLYLVDKPKRAYPVDVSMPGL